MRYLGSYFPFFMISLFLYGLGFYLYQQSTIIEPQQINSGEQSIQVDMVSTEEIDSIEETLPSYTSDEQVKEKTTIEEKAEPITEKKEPDNEKETTSEITIEAKEAPESKSATKEVVTATADTSNNIVEKSEIKVASEHSAGNDAMLKGELFDEPFNLNLPAPPGSHKAPRYADDKAVTEALAVNKTNKTKTATKQKEKDNKKTKRVFKKENVALKEEGTLQEAIVVSGNKPTYPQRAILRSQQGRVVVKLTVTMQGKAKDPQITNSSGFPILDNAVLDFVNNELFMPAHKGVDKVTSEQLFSFRFELK